MSELLQVPLDVALWGRIWEPLGMRDAYLHTPANAAHRTLFLGSRGRASTTGRGLGRGLGGAGGVHAPLRDMRTYLAAAVAMEPSAAVERAIATSRRPLAAFRGGQHGGPSMGMCWMGRPDGVTWHNGMTGGYSSYIGTTDQGAGVVILSNYAASVDALGLSILRVLD